MQSAHAGMLEDNIESSTQFSRRIEQTTHDESFCQVRVKSAGFFHRCRRYVQANGIDSVLNRQRNIMAAATARNKSFPAQRLPFEVRPQRRRSPAIPGCFPFAIKLLPIHRALLLRQLVAGPVAEPVVVNQ